VALSGIAVAVAILNRPAESPPPGPGPPGAAERARDLLPGEKEETFEYVIEGVKKTGTGRVLTLDLGGGQAIQFVHVAKGSFLMGAPDGEEHAQNDERPRRQVEITRDFYLGKFEVTQAQYRAVTGGSPSNFKGDRLPVETVSWEEAAAFCDQMTSRTGRAVRLPSEAEWEYACRAGTTSPFHFGSRLNGDLANCNGSDPYGIDVKGPYKQTTTEVGSYPANPWGLHDMHGNVWEWCRDYYGPYSAVAANLDPVQLTKQSEARLVLRGGSWYYGAQSCRAAYRFGFPSAYRDVNGGFRVLLD
jgi:formylglycine-generating enzyme required for sulfatase activity